MTAASDAGKEPLLEVRHLSRGFDVRRGLLQTSAGRVLAVDDVSLSVMRGETLGLVGESGCGKSTLARLILRLVPPDGGDILFRGQSLLGDVPPEVSRRLQMVFQDPFSSLNPRLKAGVSVGEPLRAAGVSAEETRRRVADMLRQVGLSPEHATRYPHEFSGGQRQRIAIARAVILHPEFIVCDEAVSALDASVQAQVLNLLKDMQQRYGFAYLFISHDLAVVGHMSDRVAVMYLGRIVEIAPRDRLFGAPAHPYTRALLEASPRREPGRRPSVALSGDLPSPLDPPSGCAFHPRCPLASDLCRRTRPVLQTLFPGHLVACHLATAAGQPADLQR
ncbi:MAG TPA: ATP-binding cassette domain-containing protein [Candidatus Avidesulfovibrio excrementigallinarum]|nr:ATP-binding cassette domain-containing protein [Candidatus Avidesulfovibrio excrementigallinarum]